jgi:hypothetical protein
VSPHWTLQLANVEVTNPACHHLTTPFPFKFSCHFLGPILHHPHPNFKSSQSTLVFFGWMLTYLVRLSGFSYRRAVYSGPQNACVSLTACLFYWISVRRGMRSGLLLIKSQRERKLRPSRSIQSSLLRDLIPRWTLSILQMKTRRPLRIQQTISSKRSLSQIGRVFSLVVHVGYLILLKWVYPLCYSNFLMPAPFKGPSDLVSSDIGQASFSGHASYH